MTRLSIDAAVDITLRHNGKPFAIVVAGHNGSGKSTFWYKHLANRLRMPLINADRMMLSILPEPNKSGALPDWAEELRDTSEAWMYVSQQGVSAFTSVAMGRRIPFAIETVFSHWAANPDGSISSKIDLIKDLQSKGYFVLLVFVGLSSIALSIGRVATRQRQGGHAVPHQKLMERFPRTQQAIKAALCVADASLLLDNSRSKSLAFTPVHIRLDNKVAYDIRASRTRQLHIISSWLDVVAPR